ncbi:Fe-S cluster assembly sulfur transfer protein SufU [Agromyces seonyuensis]|uniref:SUF system NifU family Fe-S cluster assembly protein n=1 Tax=Agromyces seonyuensis TaxID=2662446 RepID=A0A6I4NXI9_9MICO|nr:SUF system NifU family Fe-S cluster assembly protein [Agromyces seonyuensis]MWB99060.1 SUF system NifU family Fe-S cluster assembly protein [Agromyces seonyuensis]
MNGLESLYQELMLDHSKNPVGFGLPEGDPAAGEGQSHQLNPVCGDEITLRLGVTDGKIDGLHWEGHGCVVSQASASMLADLVEEDAPSPDELAELIAKFREALRSRGAIPLDAEVFGDAAALSGVSKFSARVKCAMLGWVAAEDALRQATQAE